MTNSSGASHRLGEDTARGQSKRRKKLIFEAVGGDTTLGGYKQVVYPLLRSFGMFDSLHAEDQAESTS